jgi:hypothetical protein
MSRINAKFNQKPIKGILKKNKKKILIEEIDRF